MKSEVDTGHFSDNLETLIGLHNRDRYLRIQLQMDGLVGIVEDQNAAYCALPLTSTPAELKPFIRQRQDTLMLALSDAGITAYDPGTAPLSPDLNLSAHPDEVYPTDIAKIAASRFFAAHNLLPTTGYGAEAEAARRYNRILITLMDRGIRVSSMMPDCSIRLMYRDFKAQSKDFTKVFKFLRAFQPGRGLVGQVPVLLGFDRSNRAYDLSALVYREFPDLKYEHDERAPIVQLQAENKEIFIESELSVIKA